MEADGETDSISLTTVGAFYQKGDKYYICYKETKLIGVINLSKKKFYAVKKC